MAKNTRSTRTRRAANRKKTKKTTPFLTPERKKEVLGLTIMVIAALFSLAIVTYNATDDLIVRYLSFLDALRPGEYNPKNALGLLGAKLAYWLVPGFLGYYSLGLTILPFVAGYVIFRHRSLSVLNWTSFLLVTASILLPIVTGLLMLVFGGTQGLDTSWTGSIGGSLSHWIYGILGSWGSGLFVFLLAGIFFLAVFDRDVQKSFDRIEDAIKKFFFWVGKRWTRFLADRKQKREDRQLSRLKENEAGNAGNTGRMQPAEGRRTPGSANNVSQEPISRPTPVTQDPRAPFPPFDDIAADVADYKRKTKTGGGVPKNDLEFDVRVAESDAEIKPSAVPLRVLKENLNYEFPHLDLLDHSEGEEITIDRREVEDNKQILIDKLDTYNIEIIDGTVIVGPTVTLYELIPAPGVKVSKIKSLEDDLALAMAARGIRIIAPIPGKSAIGIEIPNRHRELVRIRGILSTEKFQRSQMELPIALGKTIENKVYLEDLTKMPHLLIAGATGSGKSVGVNTMIAGLLFAKHPADLKLVMIDPKKIELQQYNQIAEHFIAMTEETDTPIITDVTQALSVLKSCEREMEMRYDLLSDATVRGIKEYNNKLAQGRLDPEQGHRHLPYLVVIIDELADLMMTAGKEIEGPIARLAQMARAVGIHLVLATQRPSVDVITGLIKANFPARVAYQVASRIDSRTILDGNGAERLVGNGDLLYMTGSRIVRLQAPFISVDEIDRITEHISSQEGTGPYMLPEIEEESSESPFSSRSSGKRDELFEEAARIIVRAQQGSVSLLQRKLSVGYTRAARLVDQLEEAGIVGQFEGSKARDVLVADDMALDALLNTT